MIKCIAIDQDTITLSTLKRYFEQIPYLSLENTFSNLMEANLYLLRHPADLIIMDTEVAGVSTFELIRELKWKTKVIILTDKTDNAFLAYETGVTDYMLKPLRFERLIKATNKAMNPNGSEIQVSSIQETAVHPLFVKEGNKIIRLRMENILFIEGYGDYAKIHMIDGKPLLSQISLKRFEETLSEKEFCRVHRSFIVSISQISYIERKRIRIGKELIPISESYMQSFLNRLELQC